MYLLQNEDSGDNVDARSLKEDRSENLTDIPPGLNLFTKTNESLGFKYFDIGWLSRSEFTENRLSCAYIYPNIFFHTYKVISLKFKSVHIFFFLYPERFTGYQDINSMYLHNTIQLYFHF